MNSEVGLFWVQEMLTATVVLAGPILAATLVVGLIISIFQAATTIQEQTLSYVPKMIVVILMLFFFFGYMLEYMVGFFQQVFNFIPQVAR
jgi:flagellar biosynthetic protein FliQ